MERLCTTAEMRMMDDHAINVLGLPARVLMENAANQVVSLLLPWLQELDKKPASRHDAGHDAGQHTGPVGRPAVMVCCGSGNNGGDGYAIARLLKLRAEDVTVLALGEPQSAAAQANASVWHKLEGKTLHWPADDDDDTDADADAAAIDTILQTQPVLIDAIFGCGFSRPLTGAAAALVVRLNQARSPLRVAVDVPSGVDATTGAVPSAVSDAASGATSQTTNTALRCDKTICLAVRKQGLFQYPARAYCGEIFCVPVSIPLRWPSQPACWLLSVRAAQTLCPPRPADGHKNRFGHLFCIAGASGFAGAAALTALGGLKAGTGLVTLATPTALEGALLGIAPSVMTYTPHRTSHHTPHHTSHHTSQCTSGASCFAAADAAALLERIAALQGNPHAVVLGPGLGRAPETAACVQQLTADITAPLLLDADALYHLDPTQLQARQGETVLTPHPGELAQLLGCSTAEVQHNRIQLARELAQRWQLVLVLKGAGTVIASADGDVSINPGGDHGLAKGGSGDVLAGFIGGLLAQGLPAYDASRLGVFLHTLSRDLSPQSAAVFDSQALLDGFDQAWRQLEAPPPR